MKMIEYLHDGVYPAKCVIERLGFKDGMYCFKTSFSDPTDYERFIMLIEYELKRLTK